MSKVRRPRRRERAQALIKAAQYLRMSTDQQVYSLANQAHAIAEYAAREGFELVRTYADPGRSGLTLSHRAGLRGLLADIAEGVDFEVILVYDISRWRRFQDPDESAFYEFRCRRSGVRIVYCAEPNLASQTPLSAVFKATKRLMAAEYSRELSDHVAVVKRRQSLEGRFQGGPTPYGMARVMLDEDGNAARELHVGERKAIRADRTHLVPGDPEEVAAIREVYRRYCEEGLSYRDLAISMQGVEHRRPGGPWNAANVERILKAEYYAGRYVFGRTRERLGKPRKRMPSESFVRIDNVYEPIIEMALFERAQRIRAVRTGVTREVALSRLRLLLKHHGKLSIALIAADPETPCAEVYRRHFGSMANAYRLAGWQRSERP